jgi:hypothetical protein
LIDISNLTLAGLVNVTSISIYSGWPVPGTFIISLKTRHKHLNAMNEAISKKNPVYFNKTKYRILKKN